MEETILQNTIPKGYKHSALGVIPEEWEVKKLRSVCLGKGEYGINAAAVEYSENLPAYIRITDIDDEGRFCLDKKTSVNNANADNFLLQINDVVFVRTGATVGKSYLYNENDGKLVFAGFLIRFRIDVSVVNEYFLWSYTKSKPYWDWVKTTSMRSGQPGINSMEYATLQIPYPQIPEQEAIANCLSTWDTAIEKLNHLIAQKELSKKGLMQGLLSGKKRLKGFADQWNTFHYKEILKPVKRNFDWDENELYDLISVRRRSGGIFLREPLFGYQIMVKDLRNVNVGDFLFSKMQIVHGASALVTEEFANTKISGSYIACVAKEDKLNIEYFNWLSKEKYFYHQTYISSYGVHIEKMTFDFDGFMTLTVKLPSVSEQAAIVKVLNSADKEIQLLKAKLDQMKLQKKGLMQVLLTGKKRLRY